MVWEATLANPQAATGVQAIVDKLQAIHGHCVQLLDLLSQAEQLHLLKQQDGADWHGGDLDRYHATLASLESQCRDQVDAILQGELANDVLEAI